MIKRIFTFESAKSNCLGVDVPENNVDVTIIMVMVIMVVVMVMVMVIKVKVVVDLKNFPIFKKMFVCRRTEGLKHYLAKFFLAGDYVDF